MEKLGGGGGTFHDCFRQEVLESPWKLRQNRELCSYFSKYFGQAWRIKFCLKASIRSRVICVQLLPVKCPSLWFISVQILWKRGQNTNTFMLLSVVQHNESWKTNVNIQIELPWHLLTISMTDVVVKWELLTLARGQKWWNNDDDECIKPDNSHSHSSKFPDVCGTCTFLSSWLDDRDCISVLGSSNLAESNVT